MPMSNIRIHTITKVHEKILIEISESQVTNKMWGYKTILPTPNINVTLKYTYCNQIYSRFHSQCQNYPAGNQIEAEVNINNI
jgi:hypothetical protein